MVEILVLVLSAASLTQHAIIRNRLPRWFLTGQPIGDVFAQHPVRHALPSWEIQARWQSIPWRVRSSAVGVGLVVFLVQLGLYFRPPVALAFVLDVEDMLVNGPKIASWSVLGICCSHSLGSHRSPRLRIATCLTGGTAASLG